MDETRRRLLRASGLVALLGLAGCSGTDSDGSPTSTATGTGTPTPTPTTVAPRTAATSTPTPAPTRTGMSTPTRTEAPLTDTSTPEPGDTPTTDGESTPVPTRTPGPSPTGTATPTPTPAASAELAVTDDYWADRSQVTTYRPDGLTAVVRADERTRGYGEARLAVGLYTYPGREVVDSAFSEPFDTAAAPVEREVALEPSDPPNGRQAYSLVLAPPEGSSKGSRFLMSTDPFVRRAGGIARALGPEAVDDRTADGYQRDAVEGRYRLTHRGTSDGTDWSATVALPKVAHAARVAAAPQSAYLDLAAYELRRGQAEPYARVLHDRGDGVGLTSKPAHVDLVATLVRSLPEVPADVTADSDDDMQYLAETLVGAGGDPQDAAVTLALVLQAEPFFYDTRLVEVDDGAHVAVGVSGENADFSGAYYVADDTRYYYLEAVGGDRAVGEIPDEYEGRPVTLYEV